MTIELVRALGLRSHADDLYCAGCGYGIAARAEPPRCPMCGADSWLPRPASRTEALHAATA